MTYKLPKEIDTFTSDLRSTINNKFTYEQKAEGWGVGFDGRILLHVRPEEMLRDDLYLLFDLYDGACRDISVHWGGEPDHGFAYRGDYSDWKKLLQTTSKEALSDGTFEMEGDLRKWMEYKEANYMRIGCAQELPTEFEY